MLRKRFVSALSTANFPLIKNAGQVGYYVKKMSFNQIGKGSLLKIIVNDLREKGDLHGINQVSKNRGTDVCTLTTSYSIQAK